MPPVSVEAFLAVRRYQSADFQLGCDFEMIVNTETRTPPHPDWASGSGKDEYGIWVELTLGGATQRLRWIVPGRFLMGSPDDELGRWGDEETEGGNYYNEGPRHEVRISRGFWLFDTPVTQALWAAVMDSNPSRFIDPKRPVEQMLWEEVVDFLERINARIAGLELALPTEAQWEYSCRAGTDTATYAGPCSASILDEIAWFGGNSEVGFELHDGEDSTNWSAKRHEHIHAGTWPVGLKKPNAWGLYDMLGNVFEWCADDMRHYGSSDPVTDPVGDLDGYDRALRGGGWESGAASVRAASRWATAIDRRSVYFGRKDYVGLRCAGV